MVNDRVRLHRALDRVFDSVPADLAAARKELARLRALVKEGRDKVEAALRQYVHPLVEANSSNVKAAQRALERVQELERRVT
jgi:hypothetical protein